MSQPKSLKDKCNTVLLYATGTIVTILGSALVLQFLKTRAEEHLARQGSGESDYEHYHPKKRS